MLKVQMLIVFMCLKIIFSVGVISYLWYWLILFLFGQNRYVYRGLRVSKRHLIMLYFELD